MNDPFNDDDRAVAAVLGTAVPGASDPLELRSAGPRLPPLGVLERLLAPRRPGRLLALAACVAMTVAPVSAQEATEPNNPALPLPAPEDGVGTGREQVRGDELTPEARAAIDRGIEWLVSQQQDDGSFAGQRGGGTAVTSLAAIALMAGGHLPGRGRHGQVVSRAVDYVLASAQPSGLLCETEAGGVMYHHGFAALLLGEVYGMTRDDRVKEPLRRAVRLIEQSQNPEGGWRYQPVPIEADISVTICQVMALRAARDAGIKVEKKVIDDAIEYVKKCQNADGGFDYMLNRGSNSDFARSAAGVATLYYAGIAGGEEIESGLRYVMEFLPGDGLAGRTPHYFYGHYYAAQATFLSGGEAWATWFPAIRDELIATQSEAGFWQGQQGNEYGTAMALIILQMPNRYLPVFSGKGPGS